MKKCTSLFMLSLRIIFFFKKNSKKKLLFDAFPFMVGKQDAKCDHLGTTFAVFIHNFELNVCRMVEFCIPNNHNYVHNYKLIIIMFIIYYHC